MPGGLFGLGVTDILQAVGSLFIPGMVQDAQEDYPRTTLGSLFGGYPSPDTTVNMGRAPGTQTALSETGFPGRTTTGRLLDPVRTWLPQVIGDMGRAFEASRVERDRNLAAINTQRGAVERGTASLETGRQEFRQATTAGLGEFNQAQAQARNIGATGSNLVQIASSRMNQAMNMLGGLYAEAKTLGRELLERGTSQVVSMLTGVRSGVDQAIRQTTDEAMRQADALGMSKEEKSSIAAYGRFLGGSTMLSQVTALAGQEMGRLQGYYSTVGQMVTDAGRQFSAAIPQVLSVGMEGITEGERLIAHSSEVGAELLRQKAIYRSERAINEEVMRQGIAAFEYQGYSDVAAALRTVQEPVLMISDVIPQLWSMYAGMIATDNGLQSQLLAETLGGYSAMFQGIFGAFDRAANTANVERQAQATESAAQWGFFGQLGGGMLSGAGAATGGALSAGEQTPPGGLDMYGFPENDVSATVGPY